MSRDIHMKGWNFSCGDLKIGFLVCKDTWISTLCMWSVNQVLVSKKLTWMGPIRGLIQEEDDGLNPWVVVEAWDGDVELGVAFGSVGGWRWDPWSPNWSPWCLEMKRLRSPRARVSLREMEIWERVLLLMKEMRKMGKFAIDMFI